ncbi:MAG: peptide-methionine (S)-S-oxide reductase MsrA, partial [Candidatus Altiarchaeales archaeon]|nr:peptide-methionine (S)-S-oxide reductase MsrA [Candidatus Altiarchaeales archaeon]
MFLVFFGLSKRQPDAEQTDPLINSSLETATFAGGCFWCMEAAFEKEEGVIEAVSGYTCGDVPNPSYEEVSTGATGHLEAVQIKFNPRKIRYQRLLEVFWQSIDPTDAGGQFADQGSQYQTAVFYHTENQRKLAQQSKNKLEQSGLFDKPVVTQILAACEFYPAEEYHQNYYEKNPTRYKSYSKSSGRRRFLDEVWGGRQEDLDEKLTPLQIHVTRENGTESPYENKYWDNKDEGIYVDVVSGTPLFSSQDKFDSGTGWPSFTKPLDSADVLENVDRSAGMVRTEIRGRASDSHLGHVFGDGPAPTGKRYC